MAIYAGIEGVTRKLDYMDTGRYGSTYHIPSMKAGIDGVAREFFSIAEQVERIEFRAQNLRIYKIDSSGTEIEDSEIGNDVATLKKYGDIAFSNNYISLSCNASGVEIYIEGEAYVIFKDGHEDLVYSQSVLDSATGNTFSLVVNSYIGFSRRSSGYWRNYCFGKRCGPTYEISGSYSGDTTITDVNDYFWGLQLSAGMSTSGTCNVQQTYKSFVLNGVSFPATVVNNLKQEEDK